MCRRRGAWTRRPYKLWWCYFSLYWLCSQTLSISVVCGLIGTCLAPGCFRHSYLFRLSAVQGSRHGDKTGREKLEKKLKSKKGEKEKRRAENKRARDFTRMWNKMCSSVILKESLTGKKKILQKLCSSLSVSCSSSERHRTRRQSDSRVCASVRCN